jgi:hypothetical protein
MIDRRLAETITTVIRNCNVCNRKDKNKYETQSKTIWGRYPMDEIFLDPWGNVYTPSFSIPFSDFIWIGRIEKSVVLKKRNRNPCCPLKSPGVYTANGYGALEKNVLAKHLDNRKSSQEV